MSHVIKITLVNWGPYAGEHRLDLGPGVYGVVCRYADDPERSNWGGKSWFLQAFKFALTGTRPKECATEDSWITRGESDGAVVLEMSDGMRIDRRRRRGARTALAVWTRGSKEPALQDRAQEIIDGDVLKMSREELEAGAFVGQRDVARFVLAPPAAKTAIVDGWLRLGQLRNAEKSASDRLAAAEQELYQRVQKREEAARELQAFPGGADALEEAKRAVKVAEKRKEAAEKALKSANEGGASLAAHIEHSRRSARFDEVAARGTALRTKIEEAPAPDVEPLETAAWEAVAANEKAAVELGKLSALVGTKFDGVCPVTCDRCPVKVSTIQKRQAARSKELVAAKAKAEAAAEVLEDARAELDEAKSQNDELERMTAQLESLREELAELTPSADFIDEHGQPSGGADIAAIATEISDAAAARERAAAVLKRAETLTAALSDAAPGVAEAEARVAAARDAVRILASARRNIALRALRTIEAGANALLTEAGVDLKVEARWEHPAAKGLATQCRACGAPFPSSQRVKKCETCEAPRGPKIIEELELVSTDRSGAADDAVGLAFQLSAAGWLRRKRGSAWAVVMVDEPFGQLDGTNSRSLSAHLHSVLRRSLMFEQGFIVAHSAQIMESMPRRVVVVRDGAKSSLEVEE